LFIFITPFARADIITPGYTTVEVNNYITNFNDFPDYVFLSVGTINTGMCPTEVLKDSKIIGGGYKFCSADVYAVKKDNFNESYVLSLRDNELKQYLSDSKAKEVIRGVKLHDSVPVTNTRVETNYYTTNLTSAKTYTLNISQSEEKTEITPPEKTVFSNNALFYVLISAALIALAIIIVLIIRKTRK